MMPIDLAGPAFWYPLICASIIAFAIAMYVVLDGFDLGVGILFPYFPEEVQRDQAMNSVAPFWDGNETWLVLGGTGLFVAFPLAYSIVMPALISNDYRSSVGVCGEMAERAMNFALFRARTSRGARATRRARLSARSMSSPGSVSSVTRCSRSASLASISRPVRTSSRAMAPPTRSCSGP